MNENEMNEKQIEELEARLSKLTPVPSAIDPDALLAQARATDEPGDKNRTRLPNR